MRGILGFALSMLRDVRTYKFVAVGVSTLILAEALMFVSVDLFRFDSFLSAVVVTEVTLLANFALNDAFVFGADGKRGNPLHHRLLKYHASRALSIAVNLAVFYVLNKVLLVNHLLAYFVAVVVAFGVNLLTSFVWVWRVRPVSREVLIGAGLTSSTNRSTPRSVASTIRRSPRSPRTLPTRTPYAPQAGGSKVASRC